MKANTSGTALSANSKTSQAIGYWNRDSKGCQGVLQSADDSRRISAVVLGATGNKSLEEFLSREVRRHFETWSKLFKGTSFRLTWVREQLILTTNSVKLFRLWQRVERKYITHMLALERTTDQELRELFGDDAEPDWDQAA
jgi:hypothetical protein